jgi:predicted nucleic acid-binding Zn ribbon protein
MSVTEITPTNSSPDGFLCNRCNSPVPPQAAFCSTCGERMSKNAKVIATSTEITDRYRITSLVRRSLYIQLFLAIDTSHQRPVVIRDIDISNVDDEIYTQALDIVQGEYDLLHRLCIPDVLVASDLHYSQDHLLIIQDWPFPLQNDSTTRDALTLHYLIQSGIGLTDE